MNTLIAIALVVCANVAIDRGGAYAEPWRWAGIFLAMCAGHLAGTLVIR